MSLIFFWFKYYLKTKYKLKLNSHTTINIHKKKNSGNTCWSPKWMSLEWQFNTTQHKTAQHCCVQHITAQHQHNTINIYTNIHSYRYMLIWYDFFFAPEKPVLCTTLYTVQYTVHSAHWKEKMKYVLSNNF